MSATANKQNSLVGEFPSSPLPLSGLRGDVIGIGGVMRQEVEDFVVEEIPAYEPSGTGDHLFLWIEKRGLSTEQRQVAGHADT